MSPPTIKDVARASGVSIKTVARVVNNEGHVTAATEAKVRAAILKLNYKSNLAARSLSSSRSYLVGLLFSTTVGPTFSTGIQAGAAAACRAAGYHLLVEWLDTGDVNLIERIQNFVDSVKLDGVILPPPLCFAPEILTALEQRNIDYVRIDPTDDLDRSPYVKIDNRRAAYEMTKHILDLGHHKLGFLKGPAGFGSAIERFEGFSLAMKDARLPLHLKWIKTGNFRFENALESARLMLDGKDCPTAIFAANDSMALAVLSVAHQLGIRVPQDLSVAGFDDVPTAAMARPLLTTIRCPLTEMAQQSVNLLLDSELRNNVTGMLMNFELVIRKSTGSAPL